MGLRLLLLAALCSLGTSTYGTTCNGSADPCDAASAAFSDVDAAKNLTPRNGTLRVPAGSVNWNTNTLTLTKGIKLIGAGRNVLTVSSVASGVTTPAIKIDPDATAQASHEEFRVEGFGFDGAPEYTITADMHDHGVLAIGWNLFRFNSNTEISVQGHPSGVIYQNIFDRPHRVLSVSGYDTIDEWLDVRYFPLVFGTADTLYFENNQIGFSAYTGGNATGWFEIGQSGRAVLRYNTWDFTNASGPPDMESLDVHGFQNEPVGVSAWSGGTTYALNDKVHYLNHAWRSLQNANLNNAPVEGAFWTNVDGQTGSMLAEFYGNTITGADGARIVNHRGSCGLYFNNIITGGGLNKFDASQYGTTDNGGSGCNVDIQNIDARAVAFNAQINNTYAFNNTVNGTIEPMTLDGVNTDHCGIAENTDFYNYNASFGNGTNGIGRGTMAPATTGNPNGSAYWTASTATPTTDPNVIQAGHLYKRIGGAWVDYYRPYTHPHPLAGADPGASPTPTPTPTPTATPTPTPTPTATPVPTATPTPTAIVNPKVLGTQRPGEYVRASNVPLSGRPARITYQWYVCDGTVAAPVNCEAIAGQTQSVLYNKKAYKVPPRIFKVERYLYYP